MGSKNRPTTPATTSTTSVRQLLGTANAQTAPAATRTATQPHGTPTTGLRERENDASRSTVRAATQRNMRREERGTVQGPVKKQQPDGMSHRGGASQAFVDEMQPELARHEHHPRLAAGRGLGGIFRLCHGSSGGGGGAVLKLVSRRPPPWEGTLSASLSRHGQDTIPQKQYLTMVGGWRLVTVGGGWGWVVLGGCP